ncbi:hypothetical protein HS088_TW06G01265 [Tripterygium wilfordii]|uniref:Uncharacterized protein n=1 Tax=Tripterygium wilfordii TaxID=458696 RepID=A0A7J7DLX6_TRIWF|nr:hypothetical protein HS088_TW06G01265 [Tripterygium wilfordii]
MPQKIKKGLINHHRRTSNFWALFKNTSELKYVFSFVILIFPENKQRSCIRKKKKSDKKTETIHSHTDAERDVKEGILSEQNPNFVVMSEKDQTIINHQSKLVF